MSDFKQFNQKGVADDVQLGKRGPRLKTNLGTIEARDLTDSVFVPVSVGTPLIGQHAATKDYVDSVSGDPLFRQATINYNDSSPIDIGATLPADAVIQRIKVTVTTAWDALLTTLVIQTGAGTLMPATSSDLMETTTFIEERLGNDPVGLINNQIEAVLSGGAPTQGVAVVHVEYLRS